MKLEEYLNAIKECPDETAQYVFNGEQYTNHRLTVDFGVYDNYPILLDADFSGMIKHLKESGTYQLVDEAFKDVPITLFHYTPGTVVMSMANRKIDMANTRYCNVVSGVYTLDLKLHPYQDKKIENVHWLRAIAEVIDDLGQFIIKENIPACLLHSMGWKYIGQPDSVAQQMIACHIPNGPIVSEYLRVKT